MSQYKSEDNMLGALGLAKPQLVFPTTDFIVPDNMVDKDALISSTLLRLPPELTLNILNQMDDDVDRMCLSLSCRRLLQVVKQRNLQVPCMKASRRVRSIHQDNKLAFSMMKRVFPLSPAGHARADAALCQSCFKWINMNHCLTVPGASGKRTVLSEVVACRDNRTLRLTGIFFDCAKCVMGDAMPESERLRRQHVYKVLAVLEPGSFCSVAVWISRVNMHDESEVDP